MGRSADSGFAAAKIFADLGATVIVTVAARPRARNVYKGSGRGRRMRSSTSSRWHPSAPERIASGRTSLGATSSSSTPASETAIPPRSGWQTTSDRSSLQSSFDLSLTQLPERTVRCACAPCPLARTNGRASTGTTRLRRPKPATASRARTAIRLAQISGAALQAA